MFHDLCHGLHQSSSSTGSHRSKNIQSNRKLADLPGAKMGKVMAYFLVEASGYLDTREVKATSIPKELESTLRISQRALRVLKQQLIRGRRCLLLRNKTQNNYFKFIYLSKLIPSSFTEPTFKTEFIIE